MRIVVIEPGEQPEIIEITGELSEMQNIIGGSLETVPCEKLTGLLVVCNEEGKLRNLDPNFENFGDMICGTCFICAHSNEDLAGLSESTAELVCEWYSY